MNIVLEGPDATGKSTLAAFLSQEKGWRVVPSEGPPKFPGEMDDRLRRYRKYNHVIFDRHPAVSECVYSIFRHTNPPDASLVADVYATHPLFVYCAPLPGPRRHIVEKSYDTPAHLALIEENDKEIIGLYNQWAIDRAHLVYRIGMPVRYIYEAVNAMQKVWS